MVDMADSGSARTANMAGFLCPTPKRKRQHRILGHLGTSDWWNIIAPGRGRSVEGLKRKPKIAQRRDKHTIHDKWYRILSIIKYDCLLSNIIHQSCIWYMMIFDIYIYTLLNDIDINKPSMVPLFDSCIDQTLGSLNSFAHVCLSSSILLYRRIRWNAPSVSFVGEASEEKIPSLCGRKGFWYHPKTTIFFKHWERFCKNWWLVFIDSLKLTSGSGNFQSDRDGHWFYSSGGDTDRNIFEHLNPWSKMTRRWMRPSSPLMI